MFMWIHLALRLNPNAGSGVRPEKSVGGKNSAWWRRHAVASGRSRRQRGNMNFARGEIAGTIIKLVGAAWYSSRPASGYETWPGRIEGLNFDS
jgi:hypothetical protein